MTSFIRAIAIIVATTAVACNVDAEPIEDPASQTCELFDAGHDQSPCGTVSSSKNLRGSDRVWVMSTRNLSSNARCVDLQDPALTVHRLDDGCTRQLVTFAEFESELTPSRPLVIYVHGNLIDRGEEVCRALKVYRRINQYRTDDPVDWLIWSWPSGKEGFRWLADFREKANRTDAQGLYLAWFLRRPIPASLPVIMIGYSFGSRVISGSLHALAGGSLGGRRLGGTAVTGATITVGLVAPALEATWLSANGYHGRATKNLQELVILYSRRDAILKRYWLLDRIRSSVALGYSGPRSFGPRADGSRLPVRSRDCAATIGLHHRELEYYQQRRCNASSEMARLINASSSTHGL